MVQSLGGIGDDRGLAERFGLHGGAPLVFRMVEFGTDECVDDVGRLLGDGRSAGVDPGVFRYGSCVDLQARVNDGVVVIVSFDDVDWGVWISRTGRIVALVKLGNHGTGQHSG